MEIDEDSRQLPFSVFNMPVFPFPESAYVHCGETPYNKETGFLHILSLRSFYKVIISNKAFKRQ